MSTEPHTLSGAFVLDALSPEEAEQFRRHLQSCAVCREEVRELREAAARLGAVEAIAPPLELKTRVLAAAAAAVVLAGGAIGLNAVLTDDEGGQSGLEAAVVEVFQAPDAHVAEVETSHGPLRVATSPGEDEMAVDTSDLVALDQEHVYQLWAIQDGSPVSVGVLDDPKSGAAMELPETGTTVAITVEPAGGSKQPTSEPIAQVDPAAV